jgi:hypothetical protein
VGIRLAGTPHPLDIERPCQAIGSLHLQLALPGANVVPSRSLILPADVLYVIIAPNSQPNAAFETPPLEYLAAICTGHALSKAMHAHAPPDSGLIRTFRCHSLTSKIIIKTPNGEFSAGVFDDPSSLMG